MFRSHLAGIVPGQQFFDLALHVAGRDRTEGGGQPSVGIDVVELAGLDQRGDDSPVFRPGIVSGEEGVLSVQRDGADGPLDGVAIELDPAIGQEQA